MKEKNYEVSLLLDFYGDILTEKQREVVELYYNEDLSLAEIAEHTHITRQGVRDSIKRGEAVLFEMEEKLGLLGRFDTIKACLDQIIESARNIEDYNERYCSSHKISDNAAQIVSLAQSIYDRA